MPLIIYLKCRLAISLGDFTPFIQITIQKIFLIITLNCFLLFSHNFKLSNALTKMIKIYSNTPNAFQKTNNKLIDKTTNTCIEAYEDCTVLLLKNQKLVAYSIFQGKFKDNTETFKLLCLSAIYPSVPAEIKDDTRIKWSMVFEIKSQKYTKEVYILGSDTLYGTKIRLDDSLWILS